MNDEAWEDASSIDASLAFSFSEEPPSLSDVAISSPLSVFRSPSEKYSLPPKP